MGMDETKDFFISYTHADQRWAEWIAWQLEEADYTTILQAWDFYAGGNFVLDMDNAIKQAKRTIAVLSPDYLVSRFTRPEWAAAFRYDPEGKQGLLVPVRVRSCDVKGLLGPIVYIDLVGQSEHIAQTTLLARLKRERHKPTRAPAFPSIAHISAKRPSFPGALPTPISQAVRNCSLNWQQHCEQERLLPYHNHRRSVAWVGLAKRRLHLSMPTATTRTIRLSCGAVLIRLRLSSPGLQRLQNSSRCRRRMRKINSLSSKRSRTG